MHGVFPFLSLVQQVPPASKKTRLTREDRIVIKRNPLGRKFHRQGSNFNFNGESTSEDTCHDFRKLFYTLQGNPVSRLLESNPGRAVIYDLAEVWVIWKEFEGWPSVRMLARAAALRWHDFAIWNSVLQIAVDLAKLPRSQILVDINDWRVTPIQVPIPMKNMTLRAMAFRNLGRPLNLDFHPQELILAFIDILNQLLKDLEDGSGRDPPQVHQSNVLINDAPKRLGYHGLIVDTRAIGLTSDITRECSPRPCEDCNRKFASHLRSALRRVIPWDPAHEDLDESELYELSLSLDINKRYRFCIHALWAVFTFSVGRKQCEGYLLDYGVSFVEGMPIQRLRRHCKLAPELPLGRCNSVSSYVHNLQETPSGISDGSDFRPLYWQIRHIVWKDSHTESDPRVLLHELIGALEDYEPDLSVTPEYWMEVPGQRITTDWKGGPEIPNEWEIREPIEVELWDELRSAGEYYEEMREEELAIGIHNRMMSRESDDMASISTTPSRPWAENNNWASISDILDNADAFVQKSKDILDFNKISEDLLIAMGWKDGSS